MTKYYNHGQKSYDTILFVGLFQFTHAQLLPHPTNNVGRLYPEFFPSILQHCPKGLLSRIVGSTLVCEKRRGDEHPRRPRGNQSGRGKRRDESFQAQAEKPLGTDSHRTISKRSSECCLLIGHKKCFVLLCPIGEQFLQSSFREFIHDCYYLATVARFVHQAFLT